MTHWCHGVSVPGPVDPEGCCADEPRHIPTDVEREVMLADFRRQMEQQANVYAESAQRLRDDLALARLACDDKEEFIAGVRAKLSHTEAERDELAARIDARIAEGIAESLRSMAAETRESFEADDETTWHAVGDWLSLAADDTKTTRRSCHE